MSGPTKPLDRSLRSVLVARNHEEPQATPGRPDRVLLLPKGFPRPNETCGLSGIQVHPGCYNRGADRGATKRGVDDMTDSDTDIVASVETSAAAATAVAAVTQVAGATNLAAGDLAAAVGRQGLLIPLHDMLLRLAGNASDNVVAQARTWLSEGKVVDVAKTVAFAARQQPLPLTERDTAVLAVLGADAPQGSGDNGWEAAMQWAFGPLPEDMAKSVAKQEKALTTALQDEPDVRGVWRAWRRPSDGAPFPAPSAVYVVLATSPEFHELAGRLQAVLVRAGQATPCVEVVGPDHDLPYYQRMARAYADLVWASTPDHEVKLARVFDTVDPEAGPGFNADRPAIEDEDQLNRLLDYLRSAEPLLITTGTMQDVVQPAKGSVVPMTFRTDGHWIWPDTVTYYLEQYGLFVDDELLSHIDQSEEMPEVDAVDLHRALGSLKGREVEPVWTHKP